MVDIGIGKDKPALNELEVTLIGAGSNAGESIVVHLGDGKWMVVDSCKFGKDVLPLYYLKKLEVNLSDVLFVVCTHWHKDHVRGLSEVIKECPNAKLILPSFFNQEKVFEVLFSSSFSGRSMVAKELHECLNVIRKRKGTLNTPMYLGPRDEIKTIHCDGVDVVVRSFSPSDRIKEVYDQLLVKSTFEEMAESELEPNMCSSVIDITTDNNLLSVLLGADLECNRADKNNLDCKKTCGEYSAIGWCNIVTDCDKYKERLKYNYIKAAHHSSVTGYCPQLMDTKVEKENTIIATTVFENGKGVRLPREEMMRQYVSKTDNYYITASQPKPITVKDRKTEIEDKKPQDVVRVEVVEDQCGIITTRYNISSGQLSSNKLFGYANKVNEDIIRKFA